MNKTAIIIVLVLIGAGIVGWYLFYAGGNGTSAVEGRDVLLYYYDPQKDTDEDGNIMCSREGLVSVSREVVSADPIEDTIRLLLRGVLTQGERAQGIETEYPLPGLELLDSELEDGTLTLTFADPENRTSGGACRVGILWFQIRETALQFEKVEEVRFEPLELFQP